MTLVHEATINNYHGNITESIWYDISVINIWQNLLLLEPQHYIRKCVTEKKTVHTHKRESSCVRIHPGHVIKMTNKPNNIIRVLVHLYFGHPIINLETLKFQILFYNRKDRRNWTSHYYYTETTGKSSILDSLFQNPG